MPHWHQHGVRLNLECTLGSFWAEMPDGWRLENCHPAALAVAEYLLLHNIEAAKADCRSIDQLWDLPPRPAGQSGKTLLCYSGGVDSTAALMLLPPETVPIYCRRPYDGYPLRGKRIHLAPFAPIERCLDRVGNVYGVVKVPSTFETIGLAGGTAHGFQDGYGYAVMACLLADFLDGGAVAFGSVMEQVFLGSGNNYTDIVKFPTAKWHFYRRLLRLAGLEFSLPTGGCSEVLTERIVAAGPLADYAVSCPLADAAGKPCGTCFKCFRKLRILNRPASEPTPSVLDTLAKRPLKSASSVVYACQRSGWWGAGLHEYRDVKLDFLERYHGYAVDNLLPAHLAGHVRGRFAELGVKPMDPEDEYMLRQLGRTFWPSAFSLTRAGLPVERMDSQSLA